MVPKKKAATDFKSKSFIQGFNYAVDGIISAFRNEFNMRFHLIAAVVALVLSLFFDFTRTEFLVLSLTISLVFICEMLNTAIEKTVDLLSPEYHEAAKMAKDIAAGAVLVSSVNALVVAYLLFVVRMERFRMTMFSKVQQNPMYMTLIIAILVVLITIILKSRFSRGHGTHFQGGSVSGHASISFAMATIIAHVGGSALVALLAYFLAFLVAESRVEGGIHRLSEVVAGGLLGILVTVLIFSLLT